MNGDVDLIEISGSAQVNIVTGHINSQVILPLNGTIELSTLTGDIDSEIALPLGGSIDMTVLEGDINLDIPQDTSAIFEAETTDGVIRLFNLVVNDQVRTSHSLAGSLGDGGGDIWLQAEIGSITVTGFQMEDNAK